MEMTHGHDPL